MSEALTPRVGGFLAGSEWQGGRAAAGSRRYPEGVLGGALQRRMHARTRALQGRMGGGALQGRMYARTRALQGRMGGGGLQGRTTAGSRRYPEGVLGGGVRTFDTTSPRWLSGMLAKPRTPDSQRPQWHGPALRAGGGWGGWVGKNGQECPRSRRTGGSVRAPEEWAGVSARRRNGRLEATPT